jgi:hypothetical protein
VNRRQFLDAVAASAFARSAPSAFVRVSRDRRYLELSDGSPYIPIGLNMIAPPSGREDVFAGWIESLSRNRGNYIRVWLSNPHFDVEHERSGVYDEAKGARIDRMLGLCRKHGIRVKMTLEHFRSIGEPPVRQSWADKPSHLKANGGPATSIADFFDGEPSRAQFRRKIRWYAERYGSEPVIFGWELWNEVNAVRGGDYLAWTEAMLPELRKAFPKNLCMQSLGSFDTDRVVETYRRHSTMPGNDLAQVHRYLDLGASLEICGGPVDLLAADAVRQLRGYQPNRPVILAESGAVEPKHTGPFKLYQADRAGIILHDVLFAPFFAGAAGPGQIWHWDSYVAANDLWHHFARFAEAVKGIDPASEQFEPGEIDAGGRVRVYALRGRRNTLLWIRDAMNNWQSELADNRPPQPCRGVRIGPVRRGSTKFYDPWQNTWSSGTIKSGKLDLPDFTRSLVVTIKHG